MMSSTSKSRGILRSFLTVAGLSAMLAGATVAPALAEDWHHGRDGRWEQQRREEWRGREWREQHRYYRQPGYYYAPPPVVYAPPPTLRLVFPFGFR
jgi:hypothetical protein